MRHFRVELIGKAPRSGVFLGSLFLAGMICSWGFEQGQNKVDKQSVSPTLPSSPGWYEIPNTKLVANCPSDPAIEGNTGCRAIINAWNGGIADTKRNRLIIWGGGHGDYFGNEVYGLDLNNMSISRLTEPSPVSNVMTCPEAYTDGRPSARHTYGGLAYLAEKDGMFVYGGSKSACGFMSTGTWVFDLQKMEWKNLDPHQGDSPANNPGAIAEYDPNTGTIILSDTANLFRYDPDKNSYKKLRALAGVDYRLSGVIDPDKKLFFMIGGPGQFWVIDISEKSKFVLQDWSRKVTGCDPLRYAHSSGLAYDAELREIVGWAGGDSVFIFHTETHTCSLETYSGGPGPAQPNGTFGRFQYFPKLDAFVLVNDWKQNAFLLRLAQGAKPVAAVAPRSNN